MSRNRRRLHILWGLTALAVAAAPAWGQVRRDAAPATKPATGRPAAPGGQDEDEPSESECRAYGGSVVEAFEEADRAKFDALVDWDAISRAMANGVDIPEEARQGVVQGARGGRDGKGGFIGQLIMESEQGGDLRFLRVRSRQGRRVALFRLIHPTEHGGVNYFELLLQRLPGGRIRATDIYLYAYGELISKSFRQTLLPLIAGQSRKSMDGLTIQEKDFVQDFPRTQEARQLQNQGKPKEALAIYKNLRAGTRLSKMVLLAHTRAAQASGDDKEYAAVLEEFHKAFPNDPCLDLMSVDTEFLRRDFPAVMKAIDRLDESVGGDPYLDVVRAGARVTQGDLKGARQFALRAIEREPSLIQGYWALVNASLQAKDYDETLARLEEIDQKFEIEFEDLSQSPKYAGFVKSPAYAKWLDYLKKKTPAPGPVRRDSTKPRG